MKSREAGLGGSNTRPTLFIGNLGTTHHSLDSGEIFVGDSQKWKDKVKRKNFVSAVLHGTTDTHPDVLAAASAGCHKINVAGDFLHTIIRCLPNKIRVKIEKAGADPKYAIKDVRDDMSEMSSKQVRNLIDSLRAHCSSILDTIQSPQLSQQDINYFRYKLYKYPKKHVDLIKRKLMNQKKSHSFANTRKLSSNKVTYEFSPSMIEVPFGDQYKAYVDAIWNEGARYFHIDVGDSKFIHRAFSAIDKVEYLRGKYPNIKLHAHLMVENPHYAKKGEKSIIELELDVLQDGYISFYKKTSYESLSMNYLVFYIDSVLQDYWCGNIDWSKEVFPVSAGIHTFKWEYYSPSYPINYREHRGYPRIGR